MSSGDEFQHQIILKSQPFSFPVMFLSYSVYFWRAFVSKIEWSLLHFSLKKNRIHLVKLVISEFEFIPGTLTRQDYET